MQPKIKALVVDDEKLARDMLTSLLTNYSDIEVLEECSSGLDALQAILTHEPDLVFLDIQMPDLNGFQVIREIPPESKCVFIFITAHDKYAVQAFEASAIDYLLKPFSSERFDKAVLKALNHLAASRERNLHKAIDHLLRMYDNLISRQGHLSCIQKILVKESKKIFMVPVQEVYYIEASGDYIRIHLKNKSHLVNESLDNIQAQLNPKEFFRIHRSFIVNVQYIKEFVPHFNSEYFIILENDAQVKLSRSYKDQFRSLIGKSL